MCQREQFTSDHSSSHHHGFVPSLLRYMTEESRITLLVIYSYRQDYDCKQMKTKQKAHVMQQIFSHSTQ